jgi:hypothetical protein
VKNSNQFWFSHRALVLKLFENLKKPAFLTGPFFAGSLMALKYP